MNATTAGTLLTALPAMAVACLLLRHRARPVLWFAHAMILIATGYLVTTGAARDVGGWVLGLL